MAGATTGTQKVAWSGRIVGVQPRIRLLRSFDERHHSYQGYALRIDGTYGDQTGEFLIAVGKGMHQRYRFFAGMQLRGFSILVDNPRLETAGFYKTSGIKIDRGVGDDSFLRPPFRGVPPDLETCRSRGHRRLDAKTFPEGFNIWAVSVPEQPRSRYLRTYEGRRSAY